MNDGANFQRDMDFTFREVIRKIMAIYLDDLIIFSKERTNHIDHLRTF